MPLPAWVPIREDLRRFEPYGAPQMGDMVRLNVNENPHGPGTGLLDDIAADVRSVAAGLNRYPDREARDLRHDLAAYVGHGLSADHMWAANGSNEIITQLFQAFAGPGRSALSFTPTYSMYPEYARDTHTRWITAPRADDFTIDVARATELISAEQPDIVLLTSPNNPTGTALPLETTRAIAESAPGIVIVDEAYAEFRRSGTPSALELLDEFRRVVVARTMSKAFALAGARIGYMAAHPAIVDAVRVVRLPYHLSDVSQAVARAALRHSHELLAQIDSLRAERDDTVKWLRSRGLTVADSDANFVFFGRFDDRHAVWDGLVQRGVLIRETGPDGWLRVSIGTPEEMSLFRQALTEVLG